MKPLTPILRPIPECPIPATAHGTDLIEVLPTILPAYVRRRITAPPDLRIRLPLRLRSQSICGGYFNLLMFLAELIDGFESIRILEGTAVTDG